jgi:outer membrane protein assembly factor BamE (lipoprotein component of BamABCDE complex)
MKRVFIVIACLIYGCAQPVSYAQKSMNLSMGMTKQQVAQIMGEPKKLSASKSGDRLIEKYSWWSKKTIGFTSFDNEMLSDDRLYVSFEDGRVVSWGDKYDPSEIMDKSMASQREMMKNFQETGTKVIIENKAPSE